MWQLALIMVSGLVMIFFIAIGHAMKVAERQASTTIEIIKTINAQHETLEQMLDANYDVLDNSMEMLSQMQETLISTALIPSLITQIGTLRNNNRRRSQTATVAPIVPLDQAENDEDEDETEEDGVNEEEEEEEDTEENEESERGELNSAIWTIMQRALGVRARRFRRRDAAAAADENDPEYEDDFDDEEEAEDDAEPTENDTFISLQRSRLETKAKEAHEKLAPVPWEVRENWCDEKLLDNLLLSSKCSVCQEATQPAIIHAKGCQHVSVCMTCFPKIWDRDVPVWIKCPICRHVGHPKVLSDEQIGLLLTRQASSSSSPVTTVQ